MDNRCWFCMTETMEGGECRVCHRPPPKPDARDGLVLPPGTMLSNGRFLVGAKLGRGGFGITYTGLDRKTRTPIAIKEFFPKHLVTRRQGTALVYPPDKKEEFERIVRSFIKEAGIINHLRQHPGIVHVKNRFNDNNTAYIGMELLQGIDLRQHVNHLPRPMPVQEAFDLLLPVMDAIQFIHENGVLHRDVSPDNIFLCQEEGGRNVPKLIDFGAAHIAVSEFTQSFPNVKKSGFSPLEQNWSTDSQGPWMDVYAFAATFYFAITKQVPPAAVERSGTVDRLPAPSKQGVDISKSVERVLLKGMAVRVNDRYRSMRDFQESMREALKSHEMKKTETAEKKPESLRRTREDEEAPPRPPKKNARWVRALAYAGNLLVFCGAFGLLLGAPGLLLGLLPMLIINTELEFIAPHASLCMRFTLWRVERIGGGAPTLLQCVVRNLLLAIVPFAVLEWLWMLVRGEEQMLHETLTGTLLYRPVPDEGMMESDVSSDSIVETVKPVQPVQPVKGQPAEPEAQAILLICTAGVMQGRQWRGSHMVRIGRGKEQNDVAISTEDGLVSKEHCVIIRLNGEYCLRDCDSRNGTYLNERKLDAKDRPQKLKHGDALRVGREVFEIRLR